MDHEDQTDALLEGLPEEYKPVIDQIEGRETPPTLTKIQEKLLHHETKLASNVPEPLFISLRILFNKSLSLHITTRTRIATTTTTINSGHTSTTTITRIGSISLEVKDLTLENAKFVELRDMEPSVVLSSRLIRQLHINHHSRHGKHNLS